MAFTLFRHETFNSPLDPSFWKVFDRDADEWGTQAPSLPKASNVFIRDGKLVLRIKKFSSPVPKPGSSHVYTHGDARITTQNSYKTTYGAFDVRMKAPGNGAWSTFWLRGDSWPSDGELNGPEIPGNGKVLFNIHGGRASDPSKEWQSPNYIAQPSSFFNDFHNYRMEWVPGQVKWLLDGVEVYQKDAYPPGHWKAWPYETTQMYILANIKAESNGSSPSEAEFMISEMKFYSHSDSPTVPVPEPTPDPVPGQPDFTAIKADLDVMEDTALDLADQAKTIRESLP